MLLRTVSAAFTLLLATWATLPAQAQRVYYREPAPRVVVVRPARRAVIVPRRRVVVAPAPVLVQPRPVVVVRPRRVVVRPRRVIYR